MTKLFKKTKPWAAAAVVVLGGTGFSYSKPSKIHHVEENVEIHNVLAKRIDPTRTRCFAGSQIKTVDRKVVFRSEFASCRTLGL